jgi:hypothetical protein
MVNVDWESLLNAVKMFEVPANVTEGDTAIIHGHKFVYKNGQWIEKETKGDD